MFAKLHINLGRVINFLFWIAAVSVANSTCSMYIYEEEMPKEAKELLIR